MSDRSPKVPWTSILWFIAAILAWTAVALEAIGRGRFHLAAAAGGLFCAGMGLSAYVRAQSPKGPNP